MAMNAVCMAGDTNRAQRHERPARLIACPTHLLSNPFDSLLDGP